MDTNKITDPLNRGMVAGLLGTPADMVNMLRNAGRSVQNLTLMAQNKPTIPMQQDPAYGQEWWGNKLAQFGYVSPNRNAMAEFAAGLLDPTGIADTLAVKAPMLAQGLFNLGDPALATVTKGLLAKKAYDVAPDVARAAAKNLSAPATLNKPGFAGQRGAIVWHGSPHAFDAFDASKIGTGEGAQAYGHGLYLAESPSVAKSYVSAGDDALNYSSPTLSKALAKAAKKFGWDDYQLEFGKERLQVQKALLSIERKKPMPPDVPKEVADFVQEISEKRGNLYKVDLPDDAIAKMLDWDKPLSQQAPEVQKAFAKIGAGEGMTGQQAYRAAHEAAIRSGKALPAAEKERQAVEALRKAGIPGIRYLDGGSRGTGAGTSNFVVFPGNEGLLKILERNGKPLK